MQTKVAFGGGVCYQKLTQTHGTCGFRQYAFVGIADRPGQEAAQEPNAGQASTDRSRHR